MLYPDFNDLVAMRNRKLRVDASSRRLIKSMISGNRRSPFRGRGLELDSVREYVPGDDIRNIDWRVTARTGQPHSKLFQEERERHLVVGIDMNSAMRFGTRKTFKSVQAAYVAAMLGWQGLAQQDRVSACLFGDVPHGVCFFPPKRTQKSFCHILKMLASPSVHRHAIPLESALLRMEQSVQSGSLVYLISDFMNIHETLVHQSLARLSKKCEVICIAINDPMEKTLYPFGVVGFGVNEREKIYVDTRDLQGRKAYETRWAETRKMLHDITAKLKISLVELTTESDIMKELTLKLKRVAKRKS